MNRGLTWAAAGLFALSIGTAAFGSVQKQVSGNAISVTGAQYNKHPHMKRIGLIRIGAMPPSDHTCMDTCDQQQSDEQAECDHEYPVGDDFWKDCYLEAYHHWVRCNQQC